jgi:hypothetical protein
MVRPSCRIRRSTANSAATAGLTRATACCRRPDHQRQRSGGQDHAPPQAAFKPVSRHAASVQRRSSALARPAQEGGRLEQKTGARPPVKRATPPKRREGGSRQERWLRNGQRPSRRVHQRGGLGGRGR